LIGIEIEGLVLELELRREVVLVLEWYVAHWLVHRWVCRWPRGEAALETVALIVGLRHEQSLLAKACLMYQR